MRSIPRVPYFYNGVQDGTMLASTNTDSSGYHNSMTYGEGAGYDPKCSCCWLGFAHTNDLHNENVGGANR